MYNMITAVLTYYFSRYDYLTTIHFKASPPCCALRMNTRAQVLGVGEEEDEGGLPTRWRRCQSHRANNAEAVRTLAELVRPALACFLNAHSPVLQHWA